MQADWLTAQIVSSNNDTDVCLDHSLGSWRKSPRTSKLKLNPALKFKQGWKPNWDQTKHLIFRGSNEGYDLKEEED